VDGPCQPLRVGQRWQQIPANVTTLKQLLARAGDNESGLLGEISSLHGSANHWVKAILQTATRAYPHKRREYLEGVISSWNKLYCGHNVSVKQWRSDVEIYRESTYISCGNSASSMSLAMWEMYGRGAESVVVQSTVGKLEALNETNADFLKDKGLLGRVVRVDYLSGLKRPDDAVQEQISQILFERDRDLELGLFSIKPDIYDFEQEVRAVVYSPRNLLEPLVDPNPSASGFALSFENSEARGGRKLTEFIEKVYLHPTLTKDSLLVQTVKEINKRFDVTDIPVVADKIEALGADIELTVTD
jgi:hypothetical protein